jgi:Glycosyltransferase family 43
VIFYKFVADSNIFQGKVIGFFDSWPADRKFPVDMAGFAVSVDYLLQNPNATMPYKAGHEEDQFLKSLGLKLEDIEPKANNCTEVIICSLFKFCISQLSSQEYALNALAN